MKTFLFALLCCASLSAQNLTFVIDNTDGQAATNTLPPLTSPYQFSDTPVGSTSSIVVRVANMSDAPVLVGAIYVGASANSAVPNSNFTITGWAQNSTLAPQAWKEFTLDFAPLASGSTAGYLQAVENSTITSVATLQGTATPGLSLTCSGPPAQCNGNPFNNSAPLNFGNIPSGTVSSVTFTFTNQTANALPTPAVKLQTQVYITSAFTVDTSALPSTIAANGTASFTLAFAPLQPSTLLSANLLVGSDTYQVEGTPVGGLEISYVTQAGVRYTPTGNAIGLGQVSNGTATLTFTVTNPIASTTAVVGVMVSGGGFSLSGAPTTAATLQPGQSLPDFQLTFSSSQAGAYNGTLTIGTQVFTIAASVPSSLGSPGSPLPGIDLICGTSPCNSQTFTSQQQINLSVQLASPAQSLSLFTLTMTFSPWNGLPDDTSIEFFSPIRTRNLSMSIPAGSTVATYNGQSQVSFQTGTTAGTITFTLASLDQKLTWAITIPPAEVQVTSVLAQRQSPNLVVTVNGYDNTYSVGQLSFTFYDLSGNAIGSEIQVNASANFSQYFSTRGNAGGTFALRASFPVNGDVTQIGSVAVNLTNSAGTASANQTFQ